MGGRSFSAGFGVITGTFCRSEFALIEWSERYGHTHTHKFNDKTFCYEDNYDSDNNGISNDYDVDKNATEIQWFVF